MTPDYKKIYTDMILKRYPQKMSEFSQILSKEHLSVLDVISLNQKLFGYDQENQKIKSYNKEAILEILQYQKNNYFNNTQTAIHFKLSRNTIAKWRKQFLF